MHKIPSNLYSVHQHEESIRADSLAVVAADDTLQDHLQAVHDALDHLTTLLQVDSSPGDDRHTAQLFVIRLFNIGASVLKLGLSGYYQQAFQLLRDSLEMVNLVDLFRADSTKISEWRLADNRALKRNFGPAAVRDALEKFPQYKGQKTGRNNTYAIFSEHAAHTTYKGFKFVVSGNSPQLGPFMDAKMLRALLEDMGRHLAHATMALSTLFDKDVGLVVLTSKVAYFDSLKKYHEKYIRSQK